MAADHDRWFTQEVLPHEAALRQSLRKFRMTAEDVDDLTHDALTRVYAYEDWRAIAAPKHFLLKTGYNLAVSVVRRRKIVPMESADALADETGDGAPSPEAVAAWRQELALLSAAIASLPPVCRQVMTLRKIDDLPPAEIAARLGITVSTVEKHIAKGLRICAALLADPSWAQRAKPGVEGKRKSWLWRKD